MYSYLFGYVVSGQKVSDLNHGGLIILTETIGFISESYYIESIMNTYSYHSLDVLICLFVCVDECMCVLG